MPDASNFWSVATKGLFLPRCLILALQAGASRALSVPEKDLPSPRLHQLPLELGSWEAHGEQTLAANITDYLRPDEYIVRNYSDRATGGSVELFVAYFRSLQNAYGPHSPRVCLPGSGWLVRSSKIQAVPLPGRSEATQINEYVLEKSDQRIVMVYWYQNNRNAWAEEFHAKLTLLPDLLRYRRSDESLVRLVTRIQSGEGGKELDQTLEFTKLLFPRLVEHFRATE